ncbi:MAG TPA: phosphodiesterase [Halanaerobiaceae bacterium]|jgi:putative phosphoesterase|nr:phosphodiesterase [Bacillota bacterium]HHU91581.1 phosphodiesterase [Halanaerobiaceae bacterium]HOA40761.1 phosphodiesterase [Halanaerobiales bacterium]HPZ62263.1 phosphodiesterase [Halanaerobiales bacterium]HQD03581.1 phosphodiesterase [Halanaerobiales bacterium]
MKIAVISDSHGSLEAWEKAEKYFNDTDLVLHAGDILYHGSRNPLPAGYNTIALTEKINEATKESYNLLAVQGNVDSLVDNWVLPYPLPGYAIYDNKGFRIVIYHGHQHETLEERLDFGRRFGADLVVFGHTHLPLLEEKDGVILLNPGSIALPKQEPSVPTMAMIEDNEIRIFNLDNGDTIYSLKR